MSKPVNLASGARVTTILGVLFLLQAQAVAARPPLQASTSVRATRTQVAPTLDGRDDDAIWQSTPPIDGFLEAKPSEGANPKQRTEARVAYDEENLYLFVRS